MIKKPIETLKKHSAKESYRLESNGFKTCVNKKQEIQPTKIQFSYPIYEETQSKVIRKVTSKSGL